MAVRRSLLLAAVLPPLLLAPAFFGGACDRRDAGTQPSASATPTAHVETKSAAALLVGTWQVDAFAAAAPSGSESAQALNELAKAEQDTASAVRVVYTGDQVKMIAPGSPVLSSSYEIKEDTPTRVVIKNGQDLVTIVFKDDDHMTVDRKGNAYGTKLGMRRVKDAPPVVPPRPSQVALGPGPGPGPGPSGSQSGYPLEMPKGTIMKVSSSGTVLIFPDGGQIPIGK
jgi:hypothetical protein